MQNFIQLTAAVHECSQKKISDYAKTILPSPPQAVTSKQAKQTDRQTARLHYLA